MMKRYRKFYHPKNNYFFLHIAVDAILVLAVGSIFVYTAYLMAQPAKDPFVSGHAALPQPDQTVKISNRPDSKQIARRRISRELKLSAVCRFTLFEGDQLGIGPLPPQVGEITKYWIFLAPTTDYFDVLDVTITADLPNNVSFTGRTSAISENGVAYDEADRQVSWKISRLNNDPDNPLPQGAAFEIAFAPTEDQIGRIAKLLINIRISGQDAPTKTAVSADIPDVTTKIKEDPKGGIVQP